jgi:hypothetical protein
MDALYIAITVVFFAAAMLYVRGCAALGREESSDGRGTNVD